MALLLLALLLLAADHLAAQVHLVGEADHPSAVLLRQILVRGEYRVLDRDTVLPATAHIRGDLVILGADVRVEGRVEGAVAVVGGALFLRPSGVVEGPIASLDGGVYLSGLATAGPVTALPLDFTMRIEEGDNGDYGIRVIPPPPPEVLRLPGIAGIGLPSYDRVDGLTLRYGVEARVRPGTQARAAAFFHTERGELGGVAALEVGMGGGYWAVAEVARATRTNEGWIRDDLANSLAALFARSDVRNYHGSDEVSLALVRRMTQPLVEGERFVGPRLVLRASHDRALPAGDPWSLSGDGAWRPNPAVTEGDLVSVVAGLDFRWRGASSTFSGDLAVEWAPPGVGDFEFVQAIGDARWEMLALRGHRIAVRAHAMGSAGPVGAPPQRWSFMGGPGTLPTLPTSYQRGDMLLFFESTYTVPLRRVKLPLVGSPALLVRHATGAAWHYELPPPDWDQNLGLGLGLPFLEVFAYLDPAVTGFEPHLSAALSLPF